MDVVLALVEGPVHAHGGVDEGAGALLVRRELQTNECQCQHVCSPLPSPDDDGNSMLTSQKNVPARPLDWTYWALSFAMLGVSYEINSRFEESYE